MHVPRFQAYLRTRGSENHHIGSEKRWQESLPHFRVNQLRGWKGIRGQNPIERSNSSVGCIDFPYPLVFPFWAFQSPFPVGFHSRRGGNLQGTTTKEGDPGVIASHSDSGVDQLKPVRS